MMNREERMNTLKAAGIDTGKFVAMDVPEGATIIIATPDGKQIKYDRNGNPIDELLRKVKATGYIKEDPHFRRWVMAQTFDILNYDGSLEKYIMNRKGGYYYQFDQTLDEIHAIAKMPEGEAKEKRSMFFNRGVVIALCKDYLEKLHEYVENLPLKKHRGVLYKKVKGFGLGVHCKDIEGVVFAPLERELSHLKEMRGWDGNYKTTEYYFQNFMKHMIKFDRWNTNTKLCEAWVAAYKGAGAYYTLMGLIKFHDCRVYEHECRFRTTRLNLEASIQAVENRAEWIKNSCYYWYNTAPNWYLLYGMMKEVIRDNDFDFKQRMEELYGR